MSNRQQARRAGFLYVLLAITAPPGLIYVPGKLIVAGDASATAENIRNGEWLMRLGIGSELVHQVILVFLVLALYRLFKPVDVRLARQLVVLGALISVPIMMLNVVNSIAASTLASGTNFLTVFSQDQLDALAYLFVRLHGQGITVASIFWGMWLFPFGLLVIRCGFIPRWLGYLLLAAGASYVLTSFTGLVVPEYRDIVNAAAEPLQFLELPIILWLAIWGAREMSGDTADDRNAARLQGGT